MMKSPLPFLALLLLAAATASAAGDLPTAGGLCDTCKDAARVIHDAVTDPESQTRAINWVVDNICPKSTVNKACVDVVNDLAPNVFEWLSATSDPERLCGGVGVCGSNGADAAAPKPVAAAAANDAANDANAGSANGMGCSLCMFVVTKTKDALSDPITRDKVHDATQRACGLLPEGPMRDTCAAWARDHEAAIYEYIDGAEPSELCAQLGSCPAGPPSLAAAALKAEAPAPLPQLTPASVKALAPVVAAVRAAQNGASNDNCDTCKGVVAEMHSALANPDLQQQVVDTAKAACAALGALADSCTEHVDQYAPMAFGMVLAYLQPEQVCRQLHFCPLPPPPPSSVLASASEGLLLLRGGLLSRGEAPRGGPAHFMQA